MKRRRSLFLLVSLASLMGLAACTSTQAIRIPNPDAYELRGDRYHVTMKSGWRYSTRQIRVANDRAYFDSRAVRLKDIRSIETRSFNAWKTLGLVTGATATLFAAVWYYGMMLILTQRSNSV